LIRPLFYYRFLFALALLSLLATFCVNSQGQQPVAPPPGLELTPSGNGVKLARARESFSTLSLEGSDLQPRPPMSTDHEKNEDFARELVRLQWRPNDPIDMYVIRPANVKNPPVVLYLYSFPSRLDRFRNNPFCTRLVRNGAAAVGFLSARTGYRAEHGPMKQWFISELPESLASTVHDVQLILNYLATRGDLDMSRVGMFGQGSGGAIAILAAAADARLKALDLLDPWGDWPDWLAKSYVVPKVERDQYVKADFLKPLEPLEPVRYLPQLASRAIRIQFCDQEMSDVKDAVAKLEAAAPATAKTLHFYNGRMMYAENSDGRLFEWIATALKSPAETQPATAKTPALTSH
jgi:hypothetical protein